MFSIQCIKSRYALGCEKDFDSLSGNTCGMYSIPTSPSDCHASVKVASLVYIPLTVPLVVIFVVCLALVEYWKLADHITEMVSLRRVVLSCVSRIVAAPALTETLAAGVDLRCCQRIGADWQ